MKIKILSICCLALILITSFNCGNSNKQEKESNNSNALSCENELQKLRNDYNLLLNTQSNLDIEITEATPDNYTYNLCDSIAIDEFLLLIPVSPGEVTLYIPISENFSEPSLKHINSKGISFKSKGNEYGDDITTAKIYKATIRNYKFNSDSINIELKIDYKKIACDDPHPILGEKLKNSVVAGTDPYKDKKMNAK